MIPLLNARAPFNPSRLGQVQPIQPIQPAAPDPIEIDRALAETTRDAVAQIDRAAADDKGATLEPCWRVLRVAKWGRVLALRAKLAAFLASPSASLAISEDEFKLMDEVLACAVTLQEGDAASLKKTLEIASIVVGIAGGLALIVSRFV